MARFVPKTRVEHVVRVTLDLDKQNYSLTGKWKLIVTWVITKFYFDFKNKGCKILNVNYNWNFLKFKKWYFIFLNENAVEIL